MAAPLPSLDLSLALGGQTSAQSVQSGASSGVGTAPSRSSKLSMNVVVGAVALVVVVFIVIKNMGRGK